MKKIVILVFIIGAIIASPFLWFQHQVNTPYDSSSSSTINFIIKNGDTVKKIAENLETKNLIKSKKAFYFFAKFAGIDQKILAGRFSLSPSMTIPQIATTLISADKAELSLTIREGETIADIDKTLTDLDLIQKGEFIAKVNDFQDYENYKFLTENDQKNLPIKLEGYLFPDTYFLDAANFDSNELIQRLLNNFAEKALPIIESNNTEITQKYSLHEIITMASLLEKETTPDPEESKIISGILWKRLQNNWFLGVDATSLYLKESNQITSETLIEQSPYNTRKFQKGLPPGPIGNPGAASIKAAITPEESEFWYYLHSPSGEAIYAKNQPEHDGNISKYLR